MSEKYREIVKKVNTAFLENAPEDFLAFCSDDFVWTMVGEKTYNGKAAVRDFMSHCEGAEPPVFTVDQMIAEGDSVICYGDMKMKGEDGKESDYSYCDAYRFAGEQIVELKSFIVKHKTEGESSESAAA